MKLIPKIVIWPEVALTLYLNEEPEFLNYLKSNLPPNLILITGALRRVLEDDKVKIHNSLFVLTDNDIVYYDKKKLVPFGEFIPFRTFINFLLKLGKTESQIEITTDFSSAIFQTTKSSRNKLLKIKKSIFEASICYEFRNIFFNILSNRN